MRQHTTHHKSPCVDTERAFRANIIPDFDAARRLVSQITQRVEDERLHRRIAENNVRVLRKRLLELTQHGCPGCGSNCDCTHPEACVECSACGERKEFEADIDANVRW